MYNAFWRHALFVGGQYFSVKIFDILSRSSYQVIRLGAGDNFRGSSGQVLPLPLCVSLYVPVLSCTSATQANIVRL